MFVMVVEVVFGHNIDLRFCPLLVPRRLANPLVDSRPKPLEQDFQSLRLQFFYFVAKHLSGFYMNYLHFLGLFGDRPLEDTGSLGSLVRWLFLLGGWGTTISMFLQTLKFKKYIGPTTAAVL